MFLPLQHTNVDVVHHGILRGAQFKTHDSCTRVLSEIISAQKMI